MQNPSPSHAVLFLMWFVALVLGLLPTSLGAQQPVAAPATAAIRADATTLVVPAGTHQLKDLVDAVAQFLAINISIDNQELRIARRTTIELQNPLALDRTGAEEAMSEFAYQCDFLMTPRDPGKGLFELVSMTGPRARSALTDAPSRTPEQILARASLKQPVTTSVKLETLNAVIAVNMLRPFLASRGANAAGVTLGASDPQTIVMTGIQSDVAQAIELLRKAETKGNPAAPAAPAPAIAQNDVAALVQRIERLEQLVAKLQGQIEALRAAAGKGQPK